MAIKFNGINSIVRANTTNIAIGGEAGCNLGGVSHDNLSIGTWSMRNVSETCYNIGIGSCTLQVTNGCYNIALGDNTLSQTPSVNGNIAIGYGTMASGAQCNNIGIGINTMSGNAGSSTNTAIGHEAGYRVNGALNIFIGNSSACWAYATNETVAIGNESGAKACDSCRSVYIGGFAGKCSVSGTDNVNLGYSSACENTGCRNVSVGSCALYKGSASGNVAVGSKSLPSLTTGCSIVAIGECSLYSNTNGSFMVAAGSGALEAYNGGGGGTVAIGYNAMKCSVTGSSSVAIGANALKMITYTDYSVAIGQDAMGASLGGTSANIAIGWGAAYNLIGTSNVAIGSRAMCCAFSTCGNVVIGETAALMMTTGFDNVYIGRESGYFNQTGSSNVYIGNKAGYNSCASDANVVIGDGAGYNLKNTTKSVILGYQAGQGFNTSACNIAVGFQAGGNVTGCGNIAFGYSAYGAGNNNVAIGNSANYAGGVTGGFSEFSTVLGHSSGYYNKASETTAIGACTFAAQPLTGARNTAVGYCAGVQMMTGACNVIIGSYTGNAGGLDIRGKDSHVVLANGTGAVRVYDDNTKTHFNGDLSILTQKGIQVLPSVGGTAAYGWHDLVGNISIRGTGATDPAFAVYQGGLRQFQYSVNDESFIEFHMPHDYAIGTDIYLHFHWSHNATTVTGGSVTWGAEAYYAKGHNQSAFATTASPLTVTQNASTIQYQHLIAEGQFSVSGGSSSQLNTSLLEVDGLILVRVYLSANAMTVSGGGVPEPWLHQVDIHYQSNGMTTLNKAPNFYA